MRTIEKSQKDQSSACAFPTPLNIDLGASLLGQSSKSPVEHKLSLATPVSSNIAKNLSNMHMLSKYDMRTCCSHITLPVVLRKAVAEISE